MVNQIQDQILHYKCSKTNNNKKKAHSNFMCYCQKDHLGCHVG